MPLQNLDYNLPSLNILPSFPRYSICPSGWSHDDVYDSHQFTYVCEGSYVLQIDGKVYLAQKDQIVFIPAHKHARAWLTPDRVLRCIDLYFKAFSGEHDFFELMGCTSDNFVMSLPRQAFMETYNKMVEPSAYPGNIPTRLSLYCGTMDFISLYMQARMQNEPKNSEFSKIIDYMNAHLEEKMNLSTFMHMHSYNDNYFNEKFKAAMGMPPMKYLSWLRAQTAARLLLETDLSLKQIARKVGVPDEYYFQTHFKRHIGMSPTAYRQACLTSLHEKPKL